MPLVNQIWTLRNHSNVSDRDVEKARPARGASYCFDTKLRRREQQHRVQSEESVSTRMPAPESMEASERTPPPEVGSDAPSTKKPRLSIRVKLEEPKPKGTWIPGEHYVAFGPHHSIHKKYGLVVSHATEKIVDPLSERFLNQNMACRSLIDLHLEDLKYFYALHVRLRKEKGNWAPLPLDEGDEKEMDVRELRVCPGCWKLCLRARQRKTMARHRQDSPQCAGKSWVKAEGLRVSIDKVMCYFLISINDVSVATIMGSKDPGESMSDDHGVQEDQPAVEYDDSHHQSLADEQAFEDGEEEALVRAMVLPTGYRYNRLLRLIQESIHRLLQRNSEGYRQEVVEYISTDLLTRVRFATMILDCLHTADWSMSDDIFARSKVFILPRDSDMVIGDRESDWDLKISVKQHTKDLENWLVGITHSSRKMAALGNTFIHKDEWVAKGLTFTEMCQYGIVYRVIVDAVISEIMEGRSVPSVSQMGKFMDIALDVLQCDAELAVASISEQLYSKYSEIKMREAQEEAR